jgi:hypothetical protein
MMAGWVCGVAVRGMFDEPKETRTRWDWNLMAPVKARLRFCKPRAAKRSSLAHGEINAVESERAISGANADAPGGLAVRIFLLN